MAYDVRRESSAFERNDLDRLSLDEDGCRYQLDDDERPSVAVIAVVDALLDDSAESPSELLYERVDPDALDRIVTPEFEGSVSFTYRGCLVTLFGDGTLSVRDDEDRS